jgi:hypothetical protein
MQCALCHSRLVCTTSELLYGRVYGCWRRGEVKDTELCMIAVKRAIGDEVQLAQKWRIAFSLINRLRVQGFL